MKGNLYINYSKSATPVADEEMESTLLKEWNLVKDGTQTKQFNTSNMVAFFVIGILAADGKVDGKRIVFMNDGKEVKMSHHERIIDGRTVHIPDGANKDLNIIPNYYQIFLSKILGF